MHGFYWNRGELFTHVSTRYLEALGITAVVTLIDDVYDVHSRIMRREDLMAGGAAKLTLPELITWRWAEIGLGDLIARSVAPTPAPHFVFAVKHPAAVLRRLLFQRERMPVYASFPITKVRRQGQGLSSEQQTELRREINGFRRALRDAEYAALDPLCIDEWIFDDSGDLLPRWPMDDANPMVPGEDQLHDATLRQLTDRSLQDVLRREINVQVSRRDFRLVDAVNVVACYRPAAFGSTHSGGTHEELRYGQRREREIAVVHPPEDGPYQEDGGPFADLVQPLIMPNVDQLLEWLRALQQVRSGVFSSGEEPQAWTRMAGRRIGL